MSEVMTDDRRHEPDRRLTDRRNGPKIPCPVCGSKRSAVMPYTTYAGPLDGGYRRLRECKDCKTRYTTMEVFVDIVPRK